MVKYKSLKLIAETRLKEAKVLYESGLYDGAGYLCGYVVETSLKAMICKNLNIDEYPDDGKDKTVFSSHDFDRLLLLAGLQKKISLTNTRSRKLWENWALLTAWKPDKRYKLGEYEKEDVQQLLKALQGSSMSFFTWIKKIW